MSLRRQLGALVHDWPRFLRHIAGDWRRIHNRDEEIVTDGRGVLCRWEYGSDLHLPRIQPWTGGWLLRRALADHPVRLSDAPPIVADRPAVSFVIGHRGRERLPQLRATLRSLAGQAQAAIECVVVEQSARPEIESDLPSWVRYFHTPVDPSLDYCRAATFNAGAAIARGDVLVLHDNDLLVPADYAAEMMARAAEGWSFIDLKRFIFYLDEANTRRVLEGGPLRRARPSTVTQNLHGGSIAATRRAFFDIGGFDEGFVGWGGEDLDFWERAGAHGHVYAHGYEPVVHLWHPAQKGKAHPEAPGVRRYHEMRAVPAEERIRRLRASRP